MISVVFCKETVVSRATSLEVLKDVGNSGGPSSTNQEGELPEAGDSQPPFHRHLQVSLS